jgi:hypothetical protein
MPTARKNYTQFCATLFRLWLIALLRWQYQRRVGFSGARHRHCALYPSTLHLHMLYTNSFCVNQGRQRYCQSVVPKLLVTRQPGETLPNVQSEIDNIRRLGDFVVGTEANRDKVYPRSSAPLFACHGHLGNKTQPFNASFELHGGHPLTLLDLILPNAELVFLSSHHMKQFI